MMTRTPRTDERQPDLFGWTAPSPAKPPRSRRHAKPTPSTDPPAAEPETLIALAGRATQLDFDEFVTALDDEALAHLALASARQLRRRLGRTNGNRSRSKGSTRGLSALDRAGSQLAAEWATPLEETW